MKKITILFFLILPLFLPAQNKVEKYIEKYDEEAIEIMKNHGIPASIVLGIAIHESAAGTSKLCRLKNNHFGFKGKINKTEYDFAPSYRGFESSEEAYEAFAQCLTRKSFYEKLKYDMDPVKWLHALRKGGYAEAPEWMRKIVQIINKYDLTKFDSTFCQENAFSYNNTQPLKFPY